MNENTKIFVDCHVFDQSLQGTTTYIKGIYKELIKDETKQFFFASHTTNLELVFGKHDNVHYLKYTSKNKIYRLLIEIPILIKKNKIDFAHFQYIVPLIKNCKFIVTVHDVLFLDYPKYFPLIYKISKNILYKASAKYSDIVLTVSEFSKKRIQEHFKINNISITPNAVDRVFFENYNKISVQKEVKTKFNVEHYFLLVSRWEPRKNHLLLLKTFVENEYYKQYSLVFIGVKALKCKEYENYFNSLPKAITSKIIELHKIDFQDLLLLVRASTLSVYPSKAEGFGIPPLESIAASIPTVCSNTTAMSDFQFIEDCLFNPTSAYDLDKKIKIALTDSKINSKKLFVLENYNWQTAAKCFQEAINNL